MMETYEASKCVSNQKMKREKQRGFEIQFKFFNVKMVAMDIITKKNFSTGGSGDFTRKHRANILLFKMADL